MRTHLVCGVALMAACASYPKPNDNLATSMAAARGAEEAGAAEVPAAALQLKLAQDEIQAAQALMADGEYERADYLSMRAYNDAELAIALAREEAAKRRAQQAAVVARSQGAQQSGQSTSVTVTPQR